jgi:hypothetical protein
MTAFASSQPTPGLTIKQTFTGTSLSDPAACTQALRHVKERLVVMSRGVLAPELALSIAYGGAFPCWSSHQATTLRKRNSATSKIAALITTRARRSSQPRIRT